MTPARPRARALFLDRDGTLMVDTGYVRDPNDVVLLPGVTRGLVGARELGFKLVLVSNQSGVARGIISPTQLEAVQARFEELLDAEGVALDDVRFCLHGPDDGCTCRKPAPGLLRAAADAHAIDLERSVMVGDRESDVAAGQAAGCRTILLGQASSSANYVVASFEDVLPLLKQL
ncbi:MAG TPA: HAD family hydrolase [Labilithrix sp.]|nr:HAD family hydrolase [Labilithrix sp.]